MHYNHTQVGHLMIAITAALVFYFGVLYVRADLEPIIAVVMFLVVFIIASFSTLNVSIDDTHLRIKFGYGIHRKKFALHEISSESIQTVKNKWYYGWGIRVWFWPYMWIYHISGFDAVEFKTKSGKTFRIGTDDPQGLAHALTQSTS